MSDAKGSVRLRTPITERLRRIALHDFVRRYPSAEWIDGLMLGNGDVGAMLHGPPTDWTFTINKGDVWDFRVPGGGSALLRVPFRTIRRMVARRDREGLEKVARRAEEDAARFYPTIQPCAVMHLAICPGSQTWRYEERLSMATAEVCASYFAFGELPHRTAFSHQAFVCATRPVVAVRVREGDERPRGHRLTLTRQENPYLPRPRAYADDAFIWLVVEFPDGLISLTGATASGVQMEPAAVGSVAVAQLHSGPRQGRFNNYMVRQDGRGGVIRDPKPKEFEVYLTTVRGRDEKKLMREAKANLRRATRDGFDALRDEHRKWWKGFWSRSYLELDHAPAERVWYLGLYVLACSSRQGHQAAGLQGVWSNQNVPPWCSDYHNDVNVQANYWSSYTSDHLEQAEPFYRLYEHMVPQARRDTKEYYGTRGFKFPMAGGPDGHELGGYFTCTLWPGGTAWLLLHFWWQYLYTMDRQWLRKDAWPLFVGAAEFYEDYLIPDGRGGLKVFPSYSPEQGTDTPEALGTNSTCDLALIKAFFRAAIRAGEILHEDAERRRKWQSVLERLPDYPLIEGRYKDLEERDFDFQVAHLPLTLAPVYPAGEIGLSSGREARRRALASLTRLRQRVGRWPMGGFGGEFVGFVEARLGLPQALSDLEGMAVRHVGSGEASDFRSLFGDEPERFMQVDWILGYPGPLMECLLQSHEGVVRLFPAVPRTFTGRFEGFRAEGAFRVSAEMVKGRARWAALESIVGGDCLISNPWRAARMWVNGKKRETVAARIIRIHTRKGDRIRIEPAK